MEIQGTPAPRARVLKVLRFDGAFGAEGCGGGFAAMSINAASRRAAVSLFFFPWAVALHIFGNTSRHCFPPTGMQHHSLTYDSYRDPSPAAQDDRGRRESDNQQLPPLSHYLTSQLAH